MNTDPLRVKCLQTFYPNLEAILWHLTLLLKAYGILEKKVWEKVKRPSTMVKIYYHKYQVGEFILGINLYI